MSQEDLYHEYNADTELEANYQNLINASKPELTDMVSQAHKMVVEGKYDAHKALITAAKHKYIGTELEKLIRPIIEEKQVEKKHISFNAEVARKETSVEWDFSICNDPVYDEMVRMAAFYKAEIKQREALLKTITAPIQICDEQTNGEAITIYPPVRTAKDGISVTLK